MIIYESDLSIFFFLRGYRSSEMWINAGSRIYSECFWYCFRLLVLSFWNFRTYAIASESIQFSSYLFAFYLRLCISWLISCFLIYAFIENNDFFNLFEITLKQFSVSKQPCKRSFSFLTKTFIFPKASFFMPRSNLAANVKIELNFFFDRLNLVAFYLSLEKL